MRDKLAQKLAALLEPIHERDEHAETFTHYRIDPGDRWYITILVEDPSPQRLLVALSYVHMSVADEFPGCSVCISGSVSTSTPAPKPRGFRSKLEQVLAWWDR